jgi:hypothetical protein
VNEAELQEMRSAFLGALDDPDHPVWDALLDGIGGRALPLRWTMDRHPFGHECGTCAAWRKQNAELASIEQAVLDRRARRDHRAA